MIGAGVSMERLKGTLLCPVSERFLTFDVTLGRMQMWTVKICKAFINLLCFILSPNYLVIGIVD